MFLFFFFMIVWTTLGVLARRRRLSWILSVGGTLIVALLILMAAISLFSKKPSETTVGAIVTKTSPSPETSQTGQPEAHLVELWNSLPPPPEAVKGMSVAEAERLYRKLRVMDWNGEFYIRSRWRKDSYKELAEKWEMHVDVIDAAYDYVAKTRLWHLSQEVKKHFETDPHVRLASIQSTAWAGSYTLRAQLSLEGSPKDPALPQQAEKIAREVVRRLPMWITGMKIDSVGYHWSKTGTSGNLTPAFLWRRNPEEFRVMTIGQELDERVPSERETRWFQPSWNEERRAEE